MTRIQIDSICKMQEIIDLAKAGKSSKRRMTHREFVAAMKGTKNKKDYQQCSETEKQRWLRIVNNNKQNKK